jgi:hypothetical protein
MEGRREEEKDEISIDGTTAAKATNWYIPK